MMRIISTILFVALFAISAKAATIQVTQSITSGQKAMWTSDNEYVLNGFIFVENGAELWIEAGTVVKGMPGEGTNASALIIAMGGKIYANGTPQKPIIFTAEADDVTNPNDLTKDDRGLWGGLIVLGKARINVSGGIENIEGIPVEEVRGQYGGNDDNDNSGVIRYVSIRHGGSNIGANNEINGLTLGAVGDGTTIEFVEIFANSDDAVEFFGGTVNTRYMVAAFCGDDGYDYDEGFRGKGQFWFVIMDPLTGNSAGEHDGGTTPEDGQPFAIPVIYNATYIGSGESNAKNTPFLNIRDNAGGKYYNSIFMDGGGYAVQIEDLASGEDSKSRLDAGDLVFENNIWFGFKSGIADAEKQQFTIDYLTAANRKNLVVDPKLANVTRNDDGTFDPRPITGSPALGSAMSVPSDGFFTQVDYIGAFGQHDLWIAGWTFLYQAGFVKELQKNIVQVTDASIQPGQKVVWTSDNVYILDGFVYVEDGTELWIQPGTVIKGKPGEGANASALVIAMGGKIYANGTSTQPIIFTAEADDINNPNDLTRDDRGLWGGLIVLGKATINVAGGIENIEGIPVEETRGQYGGTNDNDNSGVIRFVSIRHGGSNIGANNEINGLSLGAVGRGTTIEYVEIFANSDDGIEFFGGTVNTKNLAVIFCGDDGFDYDEGFRGKGQFWFTLMDPLVGNSAGEHDGGTTPEDGQPFAIPLIYNATYIGSGATNDKNTPFLNIRDNAGGKYRNSIFMNGGGYAIQVEDLASGEDSKARLDAGDLLFENNLWFGFKSGIADAAKQQFVLDYLTVSNRKNQAVDPQLTHISYDDDMKFDPRPIIGSPALNSNNYSPIYKEGTSENFFSQAQFIGAFGNKNWLVDWTFASQAGYMSSFGGGIPMYPMAQTIVSVEADEPSFEANNTLNVYPNPTNGKVNIQFNVQNSGFGSLAVYNASGVHVADIYTGNINTGLFGANWDASNLVAGMYIIKLNINGNITSQKIVVE